MDAIGDTQLAVRAYLDEPKKDDESYGWSYIVVYGILQVLYVQQDAAKTLANCLNVKLDLPDELESVREIRNDAIGHPTGRGAFISRITLSSSRFQLLVNGRGKRADFRSISVRAAAEKQTEVMGSFLERVVEQLVADELAHRRHFRGRPLRALLPHTLGYMTEKIAEGLREPSSKPLALASVESTRFALPSRSSVRPSMSGDSLKPSRILWAKREPKSSSPSIASSHILKRGSQVGPIATRTSTGSFCPRSWTSSKISPKKSTRTTRRTRLSRERPRASACDARAPSCNTG